MTPRPDSISELWLTVIGMANTSHDGHVSAFKFTTGWKVVFGTPVNGLDDSITDEMPGHMTLRGALVFAIKGTPEF